MLCDNTEEWDGVGVRGRLKRVYIHKYIYVYLWLIHIAVQQKPTQYCKAIVKLKLNLKR